MVFIDMLFINYYLKSGKYFKYCRVIKLIKHFLERYMDWSINIVPNCCMLLANIAKEPDLLKAILEENLINLIFKIWSEKVSNSHKFSRNCS